MTLSSCRSPTFSGCELLQRREDPQHESKWSQSYLLWMRASTNQSYEKCDFVGRSPTFSGCELLLLPKWLKVLHAPASQSYLLWMRALTYNRQQLLNSLASQSYLLWMRALTLSFFKVLKNNPLTQEKCHGNVRKIKVVIFICVFGAFLPVTKGLTGFFCWKRLEHI